jgi:hypothetical protein
MYNFTFDYDHQFWIGLVIKDVWKSSSNTKIKIQSNPTYNDFQEWFNTCEPSYEIY